MGSTDIATLFPRNLAVAMCSIILSFPRHHLTWQQFEGGIYTEIDTHAHTKVCVYKISNRLMII